MIENNTRRDRFRIHYYLKVGVMGGDRVFILVRLILRKVKLLIKSIIYVLIDYFKKF